MCEAVAGIFVLRPRRRTTDATRKRRSRTRVKPDLAQTPSPTVLALARGGCHVNGTSKLVLCEAVYRRRDLAAIFNDNACAASAAEATDRCHRPVARALRPAGDWGGDQTLVPLVGEIRAFRLHLRHLVVS
jgi:hypothetical protein